MYIISFNEAATANGRIEKFNANPDSNSGIVTVPKVIGAGESVTIPAGRMAVLPNVQVDGTLNIEGEVFIPSGATFGDLESQIAERQLKSELSYNVNTSSYIPNTLASGAIIERGSNINGEYVKFADGTLICTYNFVNTTNISANSSFQYFWTFPHSPTYIHIVLSTGSYPTATVGECRLIVSSQQSSLTGDTHPFVFTNLSSVNMGSTRFRFMLIGRWN